MKIIDNVNRTVKDDLKVGIRNGSKLSIAAVCFSIYAYQELKQQLEGIDELRFIFTSPTFVTEKASKEQREFYIPRISRERSLYGTEFEVKLRNELTQKAIAKECAEWIKRKAVFKSNITNFIMVQLPEIIEGNPKYKTVCDIGEERIRRAGEKIKSESPMTTMDLDVGFRVLKLDDTNMKDVYYAPDEYDQNLLSILESNIKEDRTDLDLLFGCLLDWGLPLSLPYTSEQMGGCTVHTYNDGDLIACFDDDIPESVIKEIAKRNPLRAVFRDSGFASSPEKINVFEIFKLYMPEDANDIGKRVKVI